MKNEEQYMNVEKSRYATMMHNEDKYLNVLKSRLKSRNAEYINVLD